MLLKRRKLGVKSSVCVCNLYHHILHDVISENSCILKYICLIIAEDVSNVSGLGSLSSVSAHLVIDAVMYSELLSLVKQPKHVQKDPKAP